MNIGLKEFKKKTKKTYIYFLLVDHEISSAK